MKRLIKYFCVFVVIFVIVILFIKNTFYSSNPVEKFTNYNNKFYSLSLTEQQMLIKRMNGLNFFEECNYDFDNYVEVQIGCDKKDGKAWGNFFLSFDSEEHTQLQEILKKSGIEIFDDGRVYGVKDSIGSVYIEKDFNNNDKIKLIFSFNLPYKYQLTQDYNIYINHFIEINNKKLNDN